jgi:NAD(P)-dependent dehydrogenase (short-subunit alcohol dehydrogenase family)
MALGSRRAARRFAWDGSRVLVTGSSSGIGREVAHECARARGACRRDRRREHLLDELADAVAAEGPTRPLVVAADLSKRGAEVVVLDECAHYPHVEAPDRVAELMLPFLRRQLGRCQE